MLAHTDDLAALDSTSAAYSTEQPYSVVGIDRLLAAIGRQARIDYLKGPTRNPTAFHSAQRFLDALGMLERVNHAYGVSFD